MTACFFLALPLHGVELTPKEKMPGREVKTTTAEVGTGWSAREEPAIAVKEAVTMALKGKAEKRPDFIMIIANSGSDLGAMLASVRQLFGGSTKIYGGTSDSSGLMTDKGFVRGTKWTGYGSGNPGKQRGVAVITVTSAEIAFGTGSADFTRFPTIAEATKAALAMAVKSAGKPPEELPKAILITPTMGSEEDVLDGIREVFGDRIPVLGGTAGGPVPAVVGEEGSYPSGVSLALIYTDLPVGWSFDAGFDPVELHSGVITKLTHKGSHSIIREIDGRPAWEVYNEWLSGEPGQLYEREKDLGLLTDYSALHPLFRKLTNAKGDTYYLYTHPLASEETIKNGSFELFQRFQEGERLYLTEGAWEIVMNIVSDVPRKTNFRSEIKHPLFSIGYICCGLFGSIPQEEREKVPFLMKDANNGAPFIAYLAWGEQGCFSGLGSRHANLTVGFLTIGEKR